MAHKAGEGGGRSGSDVVILGALPDSDQVGHHLAAGKAFGPLACLAAYVLYRLHSIVLQGTTKQYTSSNYPPAWLKMQGDTGLSACLAF